MSSIILEAVRRCGIRAIISRGWSKLGGPEFEYVFYLGDCPHEWLFQHVAAVVHHGGAGTTACGLLNGRPTAIVPFFGESVSQTSRLHSFSTNILLVVSHFGETWSQQLGQDQNLYPTSHSPLKG